MADPHGGHGGHDHGGHADGCPDYPGRIADLADRDGYDRHAGHSQPFAQSHTEPFAQSLAVAVTDRVADPIAAL